MFTEKFTKSQNTRVKIGSKTFQVRLNRIVKQLNVEKI